MYLGIDFLVTPAGDPLVVDVNVGLPGGAHEYDLTHRVRWGKPSGVFDRIEALSRRAYGTPFASYLDLLPFIAALKPFKLWMDGQGPLPPDLHPALRLEDKWVQYGLVRPIAAMPETTVFDPADSADAVRFMAGKGRVVLKRRLGRGGRGLRIVHSPSDLAVSPEPPGCGWLLQDHVDSRADGRTLSLRAVAFAGEFVAVYANLSTRATSNHGRLAYVEPGDRLGLADPGAGAASFDERSWEAGIWFGAEEPAYLRHNLYEEEVSLSALLVPERMLTAIREVSVSIERLYESLDWTALPKACFEEREER
jgi:hypothetical protein